MSEENRLIKFGEGIEIDFDFIKRSQSSSENLTLEIQDIKSVALEIKKISNRQKLYVSNDSQIIPSSEGGKDIKRYYDQSQISSVVYDIDIIDHGKIAELEQTRQQFVETEENIEMYIDSMLQNCLPIRDPEHPDAVPETFGELYQLFMSKGNNYFEDYISEHYEIIDPQYSADLILTNMKNYRKALLEDVQNLQDQKNYKGKLTVLYKNDGLTERDIDYVKGAGTNIPTYRDVNSSIVGIGFISEADFITNSGDAELVNKVFINIMGAATGGIWSTIAGLSSLNTMLTVAGSAANTAGIIEWTGNLNAGMQAFSNDLGNVLENVDDY